MSKPMKKVEYDSLHDLSILDWLASASCFMISLLTTHSVWLLIPSELDEEYVEDLEEDEMEVAEEAEVEVEEYEEELDEDYQYDEEVVEEVYEEAEDAEYEDEELSEENEELQDENEALEEDLVSSHQNTSLRPNIVFSSVLV